MRESETGILALHGGVVVERASAEALVRYLYIGVHWGLVGCLGIYCISVIHGRKNSA